MREKSQSYQQVTIKPKRKELEPKMVSNCSYCLSPNPEREFFGYGLLCGKCIESYVNQEVKQVTKPTIQKRRIK